MKLRSLAILAAAIAIPTASIIALPNAVDARGNRAETVAQRGGRGNLTPEQREAKMAERVAKLKEALGLSDAQAEELKTIREKYKPQMQALREEAKSLRESGSSREEIKAALGDRKQTLRDSMKAEMREVLTDEQFSKLEEMKAQRRDRRSQRRERRQQASVTSVS